MAETPPTIEGATLVEHAASLPWYEAVAVVLQIAETMMQAREVWFPALPDLALSADGTVTVYSDAQHREGPPLLQLATTAKALLPGAAPPELAQMVRQAAEGNYPGHSVERFVESLHYFERP